MLHFDSQAVPDIDRTMKPTQLEGSNEHREILYPDPDILHSSGIIRDVVGKMGLARLYPAIAGGLETTRTSGTSRNRLLQGTS